jgi:hypothetical protein
MAPKHIANAIVAVARWMDNFISPVLSIPSGVKVTDPDVQTVGCNCIANRAAFPPIGG